MSERRIKSPGTSDTAFSKGSLGAALRAGGAVCRAVDAVVNGENRNAFCVVRPPGHHAGVNGLEDGAHSCGFCIFNSVAIGAMHALDRHRGNGVERVAIVDFDIHHGNGTEEIVKVSPVCVCVHVYVCVCDCALTHSLFPPPLFLVQFNCNRIWPRKVSRKTRFYSSPFTFSTKVMEITTFIQGQDRMTISEVMSSMNH